MAKGSLKSRIEGNSLDLSLSELTEPPVKELAELPKATRLDLSCNKIASLPDAFCSLVHLKEVDLSKNRLKELPPNFGRLNNIQRLDLYANNLTTLPLSMCRMKNLRWLDLKDNPLEPRLKAVAGDCLDGKQCQQCAKKVVEYLKAQASEVEREKQKLKAQREQEAILKAKQEKEAEKQRLEKAEREKKKAEQRLKREQQQLQKLQKEDTSSQQRQSNTKSGPKQTKSRDAGGAKRGGCCSALLKMLLLVLFMAILLFSAAVAFSFYKHKYPLSWPYLQEVVENHWHVVCVQAGHSSNIAVAQFKVWSSFVVASGTLSTYEGNGTPDVLLGDALRAPYLLHSR